MGKGMAGGVRMMFKKHKDVFYRVRVYQKYLDEDHVSFLATVRPSELRDALEIAQTKVGSIEVYLVYLDGEKEV